MLILNQLLENIILEAKYVKFYGINMKKKLLLAMGIIKIPVAAFLILTIKIKVIHLHFKLIFE